MIAEVYLSMAAAEDRVVYQRDEMSGKLLEYANDHREAGLFNDVTVRVGKQNLAANRMVLSCYSKFFEAMFKVKMKEHYQETVEIQEFDDDSVKLLLDYIYTGIIVIGGENVMSVLAAADFIQLHDVKKFCLEFLDSHLSAENCLDVLAAFTYYSPDSPVIYIYQFLSDHLSEVLKYENFKKLKLDNLITLFKKLKQHQVDEKTVYASIMAWIHHDKENRKKELPRLLDMVDLNQLSNDYLEDIVANDSLIKEDITCLKTVFLTISLKFKAMRERECGSNILCIGGNNQGSVFEVFNAFGTQSKMYPNIPNKVHFHCCAKLNNSVFCVGGAVKGELSQASDKVYRMDVSKSDLEWTETDSLSEKRCFFGAVVYKNNLIVAGGCNKNLHLNSVELYEEDSYTWRYISDLNHRRSGNGLVVCDGSIYAVGGWVDGAASGSVERLTNINGRWVDMEPMLTPRNCAAVVSYNGFIYVTGGYRDKAVESVERYEPRTNKWTALKSMNIARHRHSACVLRGKIYVVGGIDSTDSLARKVECYDPLNDVWRIVCDAPLDFDGLDLVVI